MKTSIINPFFIVIIVFITSSISSCKEMITFIGMENALDSTQKVFSVGISRSNVTPTIKAGDGKVIWDSLYAKTIVLFDGENKVVMTVVDNQGIPGWLLDQVKDSVNSLTDIAQNNIMISSTHTHYSHEWAGEPIPNTPSEFQKMLIKNITKGIVEANSKLQPAVIGWGRFDAPEHVHNRRWYKTSLVMNPFGILDSVQMNPGFDAPETLVKPAGPVDPELYFIAIKTKEGKPLAIFGNYSLHYVGTYGHLVSADYFGKFGNKVGELLGVSNNGAEFIGIMSNGTSGDVSNQDFSKPKSSVPLEDRSIMVANDLATRVLNVYNTIDFHTWVPVNVSSKTISLPIRKPSQQILDNVALIKATPDTLFHPSEKKYAVRLDGFLQIYTSPALAQLQAITIGELGIATIPFEAFAETGLKLKEQIPTEDKFIIGLANNQWGYLPTPSQHKKGGYESWITANRVEENSSEIIVSELTDLFQ